MTTMVEPNWPPKSPRDALLSSPGGRKRYQDMQRRRENMGSPLKRSETVPNLQGSAGNHLNDDVDEQDDEDEETLQLKLAAIEAKLKLKQLQKKRGRPGTASSSFEDGDNAHSRPASALSRTENRNRAPLLKNSAATDLESQQDDDVQVPLSPTRREAPLVEPWSPRRYLLGIDKGLKGSDVSLKRPPSSRAGARPTSRLGNREGATSRVGNPFASQVHLSPVVEGGNRPKTFSERIAESRITDKSRRERAERIQNSRSSAFQFDKAEVEAYKTAAAEARAKSPLRSPTRSRQVENFSRDDILRSYNNPSAPALKRSQTAPTSRSNGNNDSPKGSNAYFHRRSNKSESETIPRPKSSQEAQDESGQEKETDSSKFETYSALHLSSRILPQSFLSRTLEEKTVFRIPDLLRAVKAPEFELPDVEGDYVVFGVVASKSQPKEKETSKYVSKKEVDPYDDGLNNTNRYMAITLTDLKWTIDLFLFDTAFPRYYKLTEGSLIAILNPTIMPPPKNKIDTNRFSLAVSSSDDKILEIGFARDIGFCKAVRKDGKTCQSWVDGRKTEFCDFHVDLQVRRAQSQRMGVNTGPGMFGPGGRSGQRTGAFGGGGGGGDGGERRGGHKGGLRPEGAQYDRESQSVYYVAPGPRSKANSGMSTPYIPTGRSAASLIDADEDPFIAAGAMERGMQSKQERMRKRLADQQRERDIASKLATSRSGGVGAEYLRAGAGNHVSSSIRPQSAAASENTNPAPPKSLGLSGIHKADSVRLSPMKRAHDDGKPQHHGIGVKKTRFITAKGIREAGRDSLGGPGETVVNNDDDDDDELDII